MKLKPCPSCGVHRFDFEDECPHCSFTGSTRSGNRVFMAALLSFGLSGCTDKATDINSDTATQSEPAAEPTSEPTVEPPYGVGDYDNDGDGFGMDEDCDDNDSSAYPGAAPKDSETACMKDSDEDGFGDNGDGSFEPGSDCDDTNPAINPEAEEIADDNIDSNCNGNDND